MQTVLTNRGIWGKLLNWRLLLLGLTGLVLSIASGWTTWDGIQNFTDEPVLSLMITFGIQGIMLVTAWLIGESFGINRFVARSANKLEGGFFRIIDILCGTIVVGLALLLVARFLDFGSTANAFFGQLGMPFLTNNIILTIVIATLLIQFVIKNTSYVLSYTGWLSKTIFRNSTLWVMFLACMSASVFFSFDSLFTKIFPAEERARAADVRINSEVVGLSNELVQLTAQTQARYSSTLLAGDDWQAYRSNVAIISEDIRSLIADNQQQLAAIRKNQEAALADIKSKQLENEGTRKNLAAAEASIKAEIAATREDIEKLETQTDKLKDEILQLDLEIINQESLADAELKGLNEGSQPGKGPRYKKIIADTNKIRAKRANLEGQLPFFTERLNEFKSTLQTQNIQLSELETKLFSLQNPAQTENQIPSERFETLTREREAYDQRIASLNAAVLAFEQKPSRALADKLQAQCAAARNLAGSSVGNSDGGASCETSRLHLAAAPLYSLNQGMKNLQASCVGGNASTLASTPEKQLDQISNCLKASNLSYSESEDIRDRIASLDRNRDDKAHRFVVTLNSFSDGNKLALLTLAIAIAIDSLVFASGVFGANVLRSPLATIPNNTGRTAETINQILANSLEPNISVNASLALETIQPLESLHEKLIAQGWSHKMSLANEHAHSARQLQKLINAAVILGAAKPDPAYENTYHIRSELIEFLSEVSASSRATGKLENEYSKGVRKVIETLGPEHSKNASILLQYMQPTSEEQDFSSQITLSQVDQDDKSMVIQFLNSASANKVVKCRNVHGKVVSAIISSNLCNSLISLAEQKPVIPVPRMSQLPAENLMPATDQMSDFNELQDFGTVPDTNQLSEFEQAQDLGTIPDAGGLTEFEQTQDLTPVSEINEVSEFDQAQNITPISGASELPDIDQAPAYENIAAANQLSEVDQTPPLDHVSVADQLPAENPYDELEKSAFVTQEAYDEPFAQQPTEPANTQKSDEPEPVVNLIKPVKVSTQTNPPVNLVSKTRTKQKKREFVQNVSVNPPISVNPKAKSTGPQIVRNTADLLNQQKTRKVVQQDVENEPAAERSENDARDNTKSVRIVGDGFQFD